MRRPSTTTPGTRRPKGAWRVAVASAAVPVSIPLVCAIVAFRGRWVPSNDWAVVVARGVDTFSPHTPLIGQWSSLSSYVGYDVHQPGPLQFWLLGIPQRLFAPSTFGPLLGQALVASAMAVVFLLAAHRRGGHRLLGPAAVVLALLFHSLGAEVLRSPYNPGADVLGLVAYLAAAWSILCEDDGFWPVLIVVGSLSVQSHVTYLIPMGCIGAVIIVARVVSWRRGTIIARSRRYRRTVLGVSVVTVMLCWSGPIIDQVWGTGNLSLLIRSGTQATDPIGAKYAMHRLVEQLGVWPRWLVAPWQNGPSHPSTWTWVSAALVGVALVAAVVQSARAGADARYRMGLVSVAALIGAFIGAARIPNEALAVYAPNNRLLWWPTAGFAWLFLCWSVAALCAPAVRRAADRWHLPPLDVTLSALALVAVVVVSGFIVRNGTPRKDFTSSTYGEVTEFSAVAAKRCVGRPGPISVTGDSGANAGSMSGVVAMLRLHGCDVHTSNWQYFGIAHKVTGRESIELRILGTSIAPPGFHRVAEWDPKHPTAKWKGFDGGNLFLAKRHSYLYQRGS